MKLTKRIVMLLIVLPVLALGAGVVSGMLASRLPATPTTSAEQHTMLVEELQLSPTQREQMRQIWESTQGKVQRTFEQAQELQSKRDDALVAIMTDQQKTQFQKIARDFADRRDELDKSRDRYFQDAVDRTKSLLDEKQVRRYDEILKAHVGPGGGVKSNG